MKKNLIKIIVVICVATLMSLSLFACSKKEDSNYVTFDENLPVNELIKQKQEVYKTMNESVTITPEEAARGKTIENTKRTVNEYGVTIYGKPIDSNTASETGKKVIAKNKIADKNIAKDGLSVTYSEYYSESYGEVIVLRTGNKTGSKVYYNKDGVEIGVGSEKSANVDIEKILANVRMGNAMAEAIDRNVEKNK